MRKFLILLLLLFCAEAQASTNYPTSVDSYSIKGSGDTIAESHINNVQDAVVALQTFVGDIGVATTESVAVTNVMKDYQEGARILADSVSSITVDAGTVGCVDTSGNIKFRRNPSETSVNWANLDAGSEANSTKYYVHAVADSTASTFAVVISTSATAPTGVTTFKLLGSFYNDGSGNITDVRNNYAHIIQEQSTSLTTNGSNATALPYDDTIPTYAEGYAILTRTITPKDEDNILVVEALVNCGVGADNLSVNVALFKDATGTDPAIAVTSEVVPSSSYVSAIPLYYSGVAGGTSEITFTIKIGVNSGTVYWNSDSAGRRFGGVLTSYIKVKEIEP